MNYKSLSFDEINKLNDVSQAQLGDEMPDFFFEQIMLSHPHLRTKLRGPIEAQQFAASNKTFVKTFVSDILLLEPTVGMPVFNLGYGTPDDVGARTIRGKVYFYKRLGKFEKNEAISKAANDFTEKTFAYFYTERFLQGVEEITGGTLTSSTTGSQHSVGVSGSGRSQCRQRCDGRQTWRQRVLRLIQNRFRTRFPITRMPTNDQN